MPASDIVDVDKAITLDGDYVVIDVGYRYNIELSRCDTPEKLLGWIIHLTEKTWMTNMLMRKFIQIVTRENKIHIEYNS